MINNFDLLINECDLIIKEQTPTLKLYNENVKMAKILEQRFDKLKVLNLRDYFNFSKHINYLSSSTTICSLDLAVNLKNLVKSESDWEKIFFIKNSFLLIFEVVNRLDVKKHSHVYNKIKTYFPEMIPLCEDFNEQLLDFRTSEDFKIIKKVRNNIAAHIEKKFENYFEIIYSLDSNECAQIIGKFNPILFILIDILNKIQLLINVKNDVIINKLTE